MSGFIRKTCFWHMGKQRCRSTIVFAVYIVLSLFLLNFKPLAIFCGCTTRLVSDLVGNPEDRFIHDTAQIVQDSYPGKFSKFKTLASANHIPQNKVEL